jgi:hypothetical protein
MRLGNANGKKWLVNNTKAHDLGLHCLEPAIVLRMALS